MFDLEQSIAEWRQRMLAAGISAPALDELESHLREEIQERKRSGASEEEALGIGVREIGHGEILRLEFNKAHESDPMELAMNSLVQIIGWVAAAALLLFGMLQFFHYRIPFRPLFIMLAVCKILVAEAGFWVLAKANRGTAGRIVSFLICVLLGWIGVVHDLWHSTPLWLCWSTTLGLMMPGVFWISWQWPSHLKKETSITQALIVAQRIFALIAALYVMFDSVWFFYTVEGLRHSVVMRLVIDAAYLLLFLLFIHAGCLICNGLGKLKRAGRRAE